MSYFFGEWSEQFGNSTIQRAILWRTGDLSCGIVVIIKWENDRGSGLISFYLRERAFGNGLIGYYLRERALDSG